ncbi:MAG TPA: endoribonuclease MazF [Gemmatirosa sp.]
MPPRPTRAHPAPAPPAAPDRGDVVWLDFDPQAGHEQAGRRPAVVVSPASYNRATGLALCCPVTTRVKGYPFEVPVPDGLEVAGVVLADQLKSLDWRGRRAATFARLPLPVIGAVLVRARALLAD